MDMIDKIVMLAEEKGWDQGELESRAGLARGRVSKWKANQGEPTARQALRIARLLGVSTEFLIDDAMDQAAPAPSEMLSDSDRAILDLFHALELDKREALRRLAGATPAALVGPWLPGADRDQTSLSAAELREAGRAIRDEEDGGRPAYGHTVRPPAQPQRKGRKPG